MAAAVALSAASLMPASAAALTLPRILELAHPTSSGPPSPVLTVPAPLSVASMAGQWRVLPYQVPGLSVHATVLTDGRVLIVEGSGNNPAQFAAGTFNVWIWDPASGIFTLTPRLPFDLFCGGHALLPSGKVLFIGGTGAYQTATSPNPQGIRTTYEFDPATGTFTRKPDMANQRWYPSAVEQGNGSVLAVSGSKGDGAVIANAERYDPATSGWTQLPGAMSFPVYPSLTLLGNGRVFYSGSAWGDSAGQSPGAWEPASNAFTTAPAPLDPTKRDQGASILLPPAQNQRIALFGGGNAMTTSYSAVADTDVYDLSNPDAPTHSIGFPMAAPKMHVLGVILPDETVFETGGGLSFSSNPVQEAAIYNPANGLWTQMNPPGVPRTYHSEAILLPDGRVATLGSNSSGFAPENRIEVFSPPYMFKGQRPQISAGPSQAGYGASFPVSVTLGVGASLRKLVLIKPASVTHSVDPNQRLVELPFAAGPAPLLGGPSPYVATVPSNPNLTPPGWYMLFAVDNSGVPSVAHWVHVS